MPEIKVESRLEVCKMCGTGYKGFKSQFYPCYGESYKGSGYLTICKDCVDKLFDRYYQLYDGDQKKALRHLCAKLDVYWSERVYNSSDAKSLTKSLAGTYLSRLASTNSFSGKSYDDTLREECQWPPVLEKNNDPYLINSGLPDSEEVTVVDVSDEVVKFWGRGHTPQKYEELQERFEYWCSKYPVDEGDGGTEALLRQVCLLELQNNSDMAAGKSIEKGANAINTLLGSLNAKPTQKKEELSADTENTPFGVWIKRWEHERPIPEIDPEMKDVDGIIKYITVWFKGHLAKMMNVRNSYSKLYDDEVAKYTVEKPEYNDGDDSDAFFDQAFGDEADVSEDKGGDASGG